MDLFTDEKFDTIRFLRFLFQKKWHILGTTLATALLALLVTFFIPAKYYSYGTIFPTASNSMDDVLQNPQFGYEVHADRLMQVLESEVLRDSIIGMFDLVNYYEVDTNKLDWKYDLDKKFVTDITFFRSKYMSIVIKARMKNPKLAADIVNAIIEMVDGLREKIFKDNATEALRIVENNYFRKVEEVNKLVDSIYTQREGNTGTSLSLLGRRINQKQQELSKHRAELAELQNSYGFFDIETKVQIFNELSAKQQNAYLNDKGRLSVLEKNLKPGDSLILNTRARMEGARTSLEAINEQEKSLEGIKKRYAELRSGLDADLGLLNGMRSEFENMLNHPEPYVNSIKLERLVNAYTYEQTRLNELQTKYENAKSNYYAPFPKVYIIDRARPSLRKASPSFSLNVGLAALAGFVFSLVFLVLWERFRSVKSEIMAA